MEYHEKPADLHQWTTEDLVDEIMKLRGQKSALLFEMARASRVMVAIEKQVSDWALGFENGEYVKGESK